MGNCGVPHLKDRSMGAIPIAIHLSERDRGTLWGENQQMQLIKARGGGGGGLTLQKNQQRVLSPMTDRINIDHTDCYDEIADLEKAPVHDSFVPLCSPLGHVRLLCLFVSYRDGRFLKSPPSPLASLELNLPSMMKSWEFVFIKC